MNVVGSDILTFLSRNVDRLLIGAFLGTTLLGFYAVAYRILDTSQNLLVSFARKLAFPIFAQLQGDVTRLRRTYGRVSRALSVVMLPGYIGLALVAQEAIVVIFGHQWAASGPVAAVLFLIGPVLTIQLFTGALLNGVGHPEITFRIRLVTTLINVVGFLHCRVFLPRHPRSGGRVRDPRIPGHAADPVGDREIRPHRPAQPDRCAASARRSPPRLMAAAVIAVKLLLLQSISTWQLLLVEVVTGVVSFVAGADRGRPRADPRGRDLRPAGCARRPATGAGASGLLRPRRSPRMRPRWRRRCRRSRGGSDCRRGNPGRHQRRRQRRETPRLRRRLEMSGRRR